MESNLKMRIVFCQSSSLCAEGDVLGKSRYGAVEPYVRQWLVPGSFERDSLGWQGSLLGTVCLTCH